MRFSIALLSLAASIVSAGYVRPTPVAEECEGLISVDFEFALGVKNCNENHVTIFDLVYELDDGQLEHDGSHLVTCESCNSYPTQEPIANDCDDCDDNYKRGGSSSGFSDDYCEIECSDDVHFFTLCDTVLLDEKNRIGEIVANHQFQFDPFPGQSDALYKNGFTIVEENDQYYLALNGETKFWHCKADDNGLYKIYDVSIGNQCSEIELVIIKQK